MKILKMTIAIATLLLLSCNRSVLPDASGSFEAQEVIVSAEANGVVKEFAVEEGQQLNKGQYLGYIDSTQLYLKLKQAEAQREAVFLRRPDIKAQLSSLQKRLDAAIVERKRIEGMLAGGAATQKQFDDIKAEVEVTEGQIDALRSSLAIQDKSIIADVAALDIQIGLLRDQLEKCRLVAPMSATVLTKYVMAHEMVTVGKPLYKIADLEKLILRVYVTGNQLGKVRLGMKVEVITDATAGEGENNFGVVEWISDKAEFTPKTIQTKDERANKVYAVKVKVDNDGRYKIGMYGEVLFN